MPFGRDKVVKCPAQQYKWQYSIYGKAPSMAFTLSSQGRTQSPLSLDHSRGQVTPGPFFLHQLISSDRQHCISRLLFQKCKHTDHENIRQSPQTGQRILKQHDANQSIDSAEGSRVASHGAVGACLHSGLISCCCHCQCHSYQPLQFSQSSHPLACFCSVFLPDTAGRP